MIFARSTRKKNKSLHQHAYGLMMDMTGNLTFYFVSCIKYVKNDYLEDLLVSVYLYITCSNLFLHSCILMNILFDTVTQTTHLFTNHCVESTFIHKT